MPIPFNQESWVWYTVAMLLIGTRLTSRWILLRSLRFFQFDDWIMGIWVTISYTTLVVIANKWLKSPSNLEPPGFDFASLSRSEVAMRVHGSKLMIGVEQLLIIVIWSCKACLLIMYYRITRMALRAENRAIKFLAIYVLVGFVFMEVLYFGVWCRPFSQYLAVPTHSRQCDTLVDHRVTKAIFNISSDVIMLGIALQMLIRSLLPLKRKLILYVIFSLGIFVVIASLASAYYSIRYPYRQEWIAWYIREASTAVLVANLPFTWTIMKDVFDLDDFHAGAPSAWSYHPAGRKMSQSHFSTRNSSVNMSRGTNRTGSKYRSPYSTLDSRTGNSVVVTGGRNMTERTRFPVNPRAMTREENALLADDTPFHSPTHLQPTFVTTPQSTFVTTVTSNARDLDLERGNPDRDPRFVLPAVEVQRHISINFQSIDSPDPVYHPSKRDSKTVKWQANAF